MSGIYLHIPFCRKACHYCNFHFSTSLKRKKDFLEALAVEIERKQNREDAIQTIYFGGGTPSLLESQEIEGILQKLQENFNLSNLEEITLECNPEDIQSEKLQSWLSLGINRLSIGIQSLNDSELTLMNRNHSSEQSIKSVKMAAEAGFSDLTLDLIYGTPWKTREEWEDELNWALSSGINHLSAYGLTVEPKTALADQIKKGTTPAPIDERMAEDFMILQKVIHENQWDAYEISNYCKPGHPSKHNSNYWKGLPYIGLGPSAHSFDGKMTRSWNISNNANYIEGELSGQPKIEFEYLNEIERINELIMTQLRTSIGINIHDLGTYADRFMNENKKFIENAKSQRLLVFENGQIFLENDGKLLSDYIISELMLSH